MEPANARQWLVNLARKRVTVDELRAYLRDIYLVDSCPQCRAQPVDGGEYNQRQHLEILHIDGRVTVQKVIECLKCGATW